MDIEASFLLQQVKEDMAATSARMHRDARRQHALRAASLALGTGLSAEVVKTKLTESGLILRPRRAPSPTEFKQNVIDFIERMARGYDGYSR